MNNYIIFLHSMPDGAWENANVVEWEIRTNPTYSNFHTCIIDVKDKENFISVMSSIASDIKQNSRLILHIYAHGDVIGTAFKHIEESNTPDNYILWNEYIPLLCKIKSKIERELILIFHSCNAYHIKDEKGIENAVDYLLAPDGVINGRRATEQYICFYEAYASSFDCNYSYNVMMEKFPVQKELELAEKDRSIICYFKFCP